MAAYIAALAIGALTGGTAAHEIRRSALRTAQLPDWVGKQVKSLGANINEGLSASLGRATFGTQDRDAFLCSSAANGTCAPNECVAANGNHVHCVAGACSCQEGYCANGRGQCLVKTKGRELPQTYKIDVSRVNEWGDVEHTDTPTNLLYMKDYGQQVGPWGPSEGTPAKGQGDWRIVVNNDDTVMLSSVLHGPQYCASIVKAKSCSSYGKASWMKFEATHRCSFYVYADANDPKAVQLRDVRTGKWFNPQKPEGGLASSRLRFYPALPSSMKLMSMKTDPFPSMQQSEGKCSIQQSTAFRSALPTQLLLLILALWSRI